MNKASLLITIIRRETEREYMELLWHGGAHAVMSSPCFGTASVSLLGKLGLESTDKLLLLAVTARKQAQRLMRDMVSSMGINLPGNGIALCAPVGSVGGISGRDYFLGNSNEQNGEVSDMDEQRTFPYDLIIAISQRGSAETVMSAARTAGAGGGTIVHAKGTGAEYAEKFFGVSLAAEKELVLIVARHEQKDGIMRAIMEKAGMNTEAHAVVFSLPVESVAGLRSVMKDTEE